MASSVNQFITANGFARCEVYNAPMNLGRLIEQKLKEAHEAGKFDNLPRKGRLDLSEDDGVPEDERLAMHLLKSNDFLPAWIEEDKALRDKLAEARSALYRAYAWRRRRLAQATQASERNRIEREWERARTKFERDVEEINRDIFHFNLRAPSSAVHRLPLRLQEEYARLERVVND